MSMNTHKICPRCVKLNRNSLHELSYYGKRSASKDGLEYNCKQCVRERAKRWYAENNNSALTIERATIYNQQHKDMRKQINKRYYIKSKKVNNPNDT